MFFCQDYREEAQAQVGSGATHEIQKVLGEKWGQTTDRQHWEKLAGKDKLRHDAEMAKYNAGLEAEAEEERLMKEEAAAGPSAREVDRDEKRARMQEDAARRDAAPKKEKKQRVLSHDEQKLQEQNLAIEEDAGAQAKKRMRFLLGQSDLFKHFGLKDEEKPESKKKKKGRMTEKQGDEEMLNDLEGEAGGSEEPFEEKVRVTKQPGLINTAHGVMRPYQIQGLHWMANLYQNGINGILADEMGLGKTLQVIAFLGYLKFECGMQGPSLIVAPLSVLSSWVNEFKRFAPTMRVVRLHSGDREERELMRNELLADVSAFDVVVTTYEMAASANMKTVLCHRIQWRHLVLDEGHRIKNEKTSLYERLRLIKAQRKLLLTGTPLQNNLHELWALLHFLHPELFSDSAAFDKAFDLSRGQIDESVIAKCGVLLSAFMVQP